MVRIGVIGLGFMGRMHVAAYGKIAGAKVTAIADKDPKRAAGDFSGGWGNMAGAADKMDMAGILGTTDFAELLASKDVDAVDICVPTPFHRELVEAALRSGKHVLCEKPLALSSGEALQLVLAALPATALVRLRQARVLAASQRLAEMAREHGFTDIAVARGPRPADLLVAR